MSANTNKATDNVSDTIASKAKAKAKPKASPKLNKAGKKMAKNELAIAGAKETCKALTDKLSAENMNEGLYYFSQVADADTGHIDRQHKSDLTAGFIDAGVEQSAINRLYQSITHPKAQLLIRNCKTPKAIAKRLAEKKIKTQSAMRAYCKEPMQIEQDIQDFVNRAKSARFVELPDVTGKIDILGHVEPEKLDAFFAAFAEKVQALSDKANAS
mgnify:CR=1 FL=1